MHNIIYNGDLNELRSLYTEKLELDDDKLFDWLANSTSLEYDEEVKKHIVKLIRKRKLNKLNKRRQNTISACKTANFKQWERKKKLNKINEL